MAEPNICTICYESLSNGKVLLTTVCQHIFHFECITNNAKVNNNKCPLCRKAIECFSETSPTPGNAGEEGQWNCACCTYTNLRNTDVCVICNQGISTQAQCSNPLCHNQNPMSNILCDQCVSHSRSRKTTMKPHTKSDLKADLSLDNQSQWACLVCSYFNSDSSQQCIMCEQGFRPQQYTKYDKSTSKQSTGQASNPPSNMEVSQEFAQIAEELRSNTAYRDLKLHGKEITLNEMQFITEGLKRNTTVTKLFISSSSLTDDHAKLIAEALKFNKTLTSLFLSYNNIGDVGGMAIADALTVNRTLKSLLMANNKLSSTVKTTIDETGKKHRKDSYWYADL